jgi:predicted signal transduction protein with EAL and GGDEF domain
MVLGREGVSLVRPIDDLGHTMGLKVVAEGVEDQGTLDSLLALGCDSAQGFYVCPPVLAADLTTWMQQSAWGLAKRNATDPSGSAVRGSSKAGSVVSPRISASLETRSPAPSHRRRARGS